MPVLPSSLFVEAALLDVSIELALDLCKFDISASIAALPRELHVAIRAFREPDGAVVHRRVLLVVRLALGAAGEVSFPGPTLQKVQMSRGHHLSMNV